MENFNELNLPEALLANLAKMDFKTPTPIQAQAIPVALEGRDILGSAQTGTGKTAAFGIPMVAHLMRNEGSAALIMTPTRELAVQVMQMIKKLTGHSNDIKTALLIGGENMFRQFSQLQDDPRIIIGTPGRINDHLSRKSLKLSNVDFLVLDETDRMLDMGFGVQIDKVLSYMPQTRQTLLFSATLPHHITKLAQKYMTAPERIAVGSTNTPIKAIKQEVIHVGQPQKYDTLTQQLDARSGSIIVFIRTKHAADRVAAKLDRESHSAAAIHGDLRQNKRDKVIRMFREKKIRILVATDVAARGLDIPHIEHVINYDLPQCPEDYIHRIGRTARAGAEGEALCLIAPDEMGKWAAIERLIGTGESTDQGKHQPGKVRERNRNSSGFGRKNERGYKGRDGGFKQDRSRKPHRKGQSWQAAHDERKAQEAAHAPVKERFERKFERRDEKKSFDRNDRPQRAERTERFERSERPFKRDDRGGDRPFQKRDGESKPWQKKREGGSDRPYQKREGGFEKKPWQKRERNEGGNDRPYAKRDGESKPWQKKREGGNDRPYQKRDRAEGGYEKKPWQKRERSEGGNDRPYVKRERSEGGAVKPWHKKREGASDRPFKKREGGSGKPYQKREGGSDRPRFHDGDKPFKRRSNNA